MYTRTISLQLKILQTHNVQLQLAVLLQWWSCRTEHEGRSPVRPWWRAGTGLQRSPWPPSCRRTTSSSPPSPGPSSYPVRRPLWKTCFLLLFTQIDIKIGHYRPASYTVLSGRKSEYIFVRAFYYLITRSRRKHLIYISKLVPWKSDGVQRQSYNFESFSIILYCGLFYTGFYYTVQIGWASTNRYFKIVIFPQQLRFWPKQQKIFKIVGNIGADKVQRLQRYITGNEKIFWTCRPPRRSKRVFYHCTIEAIHCK